jgi:hypothetical protein
MARDWRRALLATLGAAMLAGASVPGSAPGAHAQVSADAEPEEEARGAGSKSPGKRRQDPADAQRAVDAALKHLQAGRAEQAVQAMSVTLSGGNLPPAVMAKAFYIRGMAYRQLGKPAQAISDLTSALWLKGGLGGDERTAATKERAAAYADAGLAEGREVAAPAKSGSGNWLSSLFGTSAPSAPPARTPAPPPSAPSTPKVSSTVERAEAAPAARAPAQAAGAWTSKTQVQPPQPALAAAPPRQPAKAAAPPAARAEPPARTAGGHLVQLGAVRTEAEAQALAAKAKREHATVLAARDQRIDRAVMGNMGAFYRVRFGPFGSAQETQAVCAKLRGSGLDCMPVSR